MGSLIEMILWGALLAAIVGGAYAAWDGFKTSISQPYVAAQIAKDQKVVDKYKADAEQADREAEHARADAAEAHKAADAQTKALAEAEALTKAAQDAARKAGIAYAQAIAKASGRITALQSQAGGAPVGGRDCAAVLSATDAILRESARTRLAVDAQP